jgi:hypothetical protein
MERAIEFATDITVSEIIVRYTPFVESYLLHAWRTHRPSPVGRADAISGRDHLDRGVAVFL